MEEKNKLYCSFSLRGLVIFLLVLLPNLIFFTFPSETSQNVLEDKSAWISFLQNFFQLVLVFMLVVVKSTKKNRIFDIRIIVASIFLVLYYVLWVRYFIGGRDYSIISSSMTISMAMAAFPAIYFILAELWLENKIGAFIALCFGIAHVVNTYLNL